MRRGGGPVAALAGFELRRLLSPPGAAAGVLAFTTLLVAGHWSYWSALPPRAEDDRLFGWAYILGMCALLRFGLGEDRERAFDEYIVVNLLSPLRYLAGKLLAVTALLAAFGTGAFLSAYALAAGDWRYAAWYTILFTLVAWVFLPAVLLVELAVGTRYPVLFVLICFIAALTVGRVFAGPTTLVHALGLDVVRFDYASLAPLAWRGLASTWLLVLLYPLCRLRLLGRAGWASGGI